MGMTSAVRAGIDIGTNSVRLLLVDAAGETVARVATVTKLGQGVDATRTLRADAMDRTLAACSEAVATASEHGLQLSPANTRIIATSASRDALNGAEFLQRVAAITSVHPEILSGEAEGALAWAGATAEFEPRFNVIENPELDCVFDIGGGSTEFIVGQGGSAAQGVYSIDAGCVRMTEQFLGSNPPTAEELSGLITVMHAYLDDVERELPLVKEVTRFIGVAGSIITVAALELGRYNRDEIHKMWLTRAAAEDVFRTVAQESAADRAYNPGLHPDRVGTIVAGAGMLVTIMRHFTLDGIWVSEADLLDAVARP
jgi:exopolyphosphatase / guanosine-5'-triphosphate,3'-diphosphate pyrophosphatase